MDFICVVVKCAGVNGSKEADEPRVGEGVMMLRGADEQPSNGLPCQRLGHGREVLRSHKPKA